MAASTTKNAGAGSKKKAAKAPSKEGPARKKAATKKAATKKAATKKAASKKAPTKKAPTKKGPATKGAWTVPPQTREPGEDRCWLVKSEPDVFSYDHLTRAPDQATQWDGVRNYTARNFMRDAMWVGDPVLFYHSNAKPPGVVGLCRVCRTAHPDPTAFDPKSKYYDASSNPEAPRWVAVDVQAVARFPTMVPLDDLKDNPALSEMLVVQRGQRLSVQPVAREHLREVLRMGGLDPEEHGV
jgi:predicted RNA-binding protein with PUA-like domain